ncbi:hypothetical protein GFL39_26420 [Rhizobium leguminosarum bv. viciae]|uniref:hypothetical protein n=1 Tax=Rhizobium leguminosarum TaxID=384 RepID=UPI001441BB3F|nr:hypothetical protein [Rhizobium leguminosarum]NKL08408.1 hypothetical protein [Rhizobium leguminosarum bv. viciae]
MKTVLITFAERPIKDYPLAVVVIDPESRWPLHRGQEHLVRSLRDARIYANGLCSGAHIAAPSDRTWPVNPTLDERLVEQTLS